MNKMSIKTGDTVVVLSGKDKGKKGKVLKVMETRPLSKDKRWRVVEIIEKAK